MRFSERQPGKQTGSTAISEEPQPPSRFFYGYTVVLAASCIMVAAFGTRFVFGVFFKPMAAEFNWSSAETSAAFSLSLILEGLMGVAMGVLTDKLGPRIVVMLSAVLTGAGYLAMSQVSSIWQFYLFYGVIIGIGMGGFFVPLVTTTSRWFTRRRGMMTGVVLSGTGVGMLIASPAANWLIYTYSWQTSYLVVGGVLFVVVMIAAQFLRRDPSRVGQLPYGEYKDKLDDDGALTLKEIIRTSQFWLIIMMFICLGYCIYSANVHMVPAAIERGISATSSATVLAISGGLSILGRVLLGNIADRIGNSRALMIGFALMSAALFWLMPATRFWAFALFAVVFGVGYGGTGASQSPLVAELFGLKSHGLIYGVCGLGFIIGAALGPFLSGYLFDVTQSYQVAFLISAVMGIIGIITTAVIRPFKKKSM